MGCVAGYRELFTATEARAHPLRPSLDIGVRISGLCKVKADRPVVPAPSDRPSGAAFQVPIRLPLPTEGVVQAKSAAGDVAAVTIPNCHGSDDHSAERPAVHTDADSAKFLHALVKPVRAKA